MKIKYDAQKLSIRIYSPTTKGEYLYIYLQEHLVWVDWRSDGVSVISNWFNENLKLLTRGVIDRQTPIEILLDYIIETEPENTLDVGEHHRYVKSKCEQLVAEYCNGI